MGAHRLEEGFDAPQRGNLDLVGVIDVGEVVQRRKPAIARPRGTHTSATTFLAQSLRLSVSRFLSLVLRAAK